MNPFEKILERLEEYEYNDLIEHNSEQCEHCKSIDCEIGMDCTICVMDKAKEIVQEVAEEYNNGWIPCSERLPDEHKLYDITFKNDAGIHSDSAIYNPYLKRWLWDADETELVENEVLAWADKREPYQPKGE